MELNRNLYRKSAVDIACREFKTKAKEKGRYFVVELDGRDAREFANYVLAIMKTC
jgi:hypothetical protein